MKYSLLYDGSCGMCRGYVEWLKRNIPEWRIDYLSTADPDVCARFPDLTTQALERQMHLAGPDGKRLGGARAIAATLKFIPKYRWVGIILDFLPLRPFAFLGYRIVARLRHKLGRSCDLAKR